MEDPPQTHPSLIRTPLAFKLICLFLLLALIPLATMGVITYRSSRDALEQRILEDTQVTVKAKGEAIRSLLQHLRGRAVDFSSDGFVRDATAAILGSKSRDKVVRDLNRHLRVSKMVLDPVIYGILVLDRQGRVLAASDESEVGLDESGHAYYQNALGLEYGIAVVSEAHRAHHFKPGIPSLAVSAVLTHRRTGKPLGMLVNLTTLQHVAALVGAPGEGQGSIPSTISGRSLSPPRADFRPPRRTEGTDFHLLDHKGRLITSSRYQEAVFLKKRIHPQAVEACARGEEAVGMAPGSEGRPALVAAACLHKPGWVLVAEVDQARAFASVRRLGNWYLLVGFLVAGATIVLAYVFTRALSQPVILLTRAARQIAKGEEGVIKVPVQCKDEVGDLAESFNAMAVSLREREAELRASKQEMDAILSHMGDGVALVDQDYKLRYQNQRFTDLFGDAVGETCYQVYMRRKQPCEGCRLQLGEERCCPHSEVHTPDGRTFLITHSVIQNPDGTLAQVDVVKDVSEREQVRQQLIQADKLASMGEMLSGVAHELNNPLTAVLGFAELLQETEADPKAKANLGRVYREAVRMRRIVQNLLSFSRQHKPERVLVNVNEVIQSTLELKTYDLRLKNVEVQSRFEEALPSTLADPHQIQQVLLNLIINAEQAMAEAHGGGTLTVETRMIPDETGPKIWIRVSDTGPGIPPEALGRIFDPFFTTKEPGKGTGLGLSVSYTIVKEHDGTLSVESAPGEGATFTVVLPVTEAEVWEAEGD